MIKCGNEVSDNNFSLFGQENTGATWALCKMNMFLHKVDDAKIEWGDTISNPLHLVDGNLMKFQVVVANPPFSLDKWAMGFSGDNDKEFKMENSLDAHNRFSWGVPPRSKGDYAFVLHMLHSLAENGRMGVVLPHGVLFRGASEGRIRKEIIENNLLNAVIGLPANLFYGVGIPVTILVFKKNRERKNILFIDASGEGNYEKGKNQNRLREQDINKIVETYNSYKTVDKYSYVASPDEIKENDYNLNIPRYVDTFKEEEPVDMDKVKENIKKLKVEIANVEKQMEIYLEELGL